MSGVVWGLRDSRNTLSFLEEKTLERWGSSQEIVVWLSSSTLILTVTNFFLSHCKKQLPFNSFIDSAHVTLLGVSLKSLLLSRKTVLYQHPSDLWKTSHVVKLAHQDVQIIHIVRLFCQRNLCIRVIFKH